MKLNRLPSGCQPLDQLLGGGFESGIITQLYGEAGTGKTNVVLQLSVQAVARGMKVVFIDTEGFSADRFTQIAGQDAKEIASRIAIFEPMNLEQQHVSIKDASKIIGRDFGLVVLDSATSLYRVELEADDNRAIIRSLSSQMGELNEIARRHRIPAVITNQVYTEIETNRLRPIGGTNMDHISKAIISLEKVGNGVRRARIVKHRSQPEGETAQFRITGSGIE